MGSKGRRYPRDQIKRQKQRQIYNQKATPTENEGFPEHGEMADGDQDYSQLKARVPVETSTWIHVAAFLKETGSILAAIVVFVAAIFWLARIEFKVDKAEADINEQKSNLKSLSTNVHEINIFHAEVKKDLEYLKESKKETKQDILSIQNKVDKKTKKKNSTETNKANKSVN